MTLDSLVRARPGLGVLASYPHDANDRQPATPDDDQTHQQDERQLMLNWVLGQREGKGEVVSSDERGRGLGEQAADARRTVWHASKSSAQSPPWSRKASPRATCERCVRSREISVGVTSGGSRRSFERTLQREATGEPDDQLRAEITSLELGEPFESSLIGVCDVLKRERAWAEQVSRSSVSEGGWVGLSKRGRPHLSDLLGPPGRRRPIGRRFGHC